MTYGIIEGPARVKEMAGWIRSQHAGMAGIVYCRSRLRTEHLAKELRDLGLTGRQRQSDNDIADNDIAVWHVDFGKAGQPEIEALASRFRGNRIDQGGPVNAASSTPTLNFVVQLVPQGRKSGFNRALWILKVLRSGNRVVDGLVGCDDKTVDATWTFVQEDRAREVREVFLQDWQKGRFQAGVCFLCLRRPWSRR